MIIRLILLTLVTVLAANAQSSELHTKWPIKDGTYTIKNFRFGAGESLPDLKLHYLTLGEPHRDASGHTNTAVLLLHGTRGTPHLPLNPAFPALPFRPPQPP